MQKKHSFPTSWNLSLLMPDTSDSFKEKEQKKIQKAHALFIAKWGKNKGYLIKPNILTQALTEYEALMARVGTDGAIGYYSYLRLMQDQDDPNIKAAFAKAQDFSNTQKNNLQFFELDLAKIPKPTQAKMLSYKPLLPYKHFLERIFAQAEYVLSEAEEKILTLKADTSYTNWVQMTASFLAKEDHDVINEEGKKESKNFSEILSLLNSQNKKTRDSAAQAFNIILEKHVETATEELNNVLANKKTDDELRGMKRADFSRHLADDIESSVVDTLIATVSKRYDLAHRFYTLKAKLLKTPKLAYHERNVEIGSIDKDYDYQTSIELVSRVFDQLDPTFTHILHRLQNNGQVDVFPKKGKRSGAFCIYWLLTQPTYVLLNHTNRLNDVLTLAHEMGHAINNELIREKQNALNFGTPTSTAEVASTFMEDFVLEELLKTADKHTKLSLLMMKLNGDISAIFRQVACYQFEQELHSTYRQKGYLPRAEIGSIFQKHMASYMGPSVEQSKGCENWWVYWSHIRTYFYVYSYASGLLISKSLQNGVRSDSRFIEPVKGFLSSGLSATPQTIFNNVGIDITKKSFWEKGLSEIDRLLTETEKLAKI